MRFNRLDLNLLVALDHLLTLRSISRAAERMNMSQSAMSNALARIREYFDDPILVQNGRKMELTARAEAMQDAVRDILVRIETTVTTEPEFDPTQSTRQFRVLVSDYTLHTVVPHFLRLAYAESPSLGFDFLQQIENPYGLLERGEADFLIAPQAMCSPDHPLEELWEDEFICAVWNQGRHAEGITRDDFFEAGHVRMSPPSRAKTYEARFIESSARERTVSVTSYSFYALAEMVVETDRIATMHAILARKAARMLPIVMHPLPVPNDRFSQCLQWHEYRDNDPGLLWARALFARAVEDMLAEDKAA
ncbi:MAG: LysR family transcriptional regulator [Pseudomonadota bacterium]